MQQWSERQNHVKTRLICLGNTQMTKILAETNSHPNTAIHTAPVVLADPSSFRNTGSVWCPYRQVTLLQQALTSNKRKVAFFLGAGCGVSVRVKRRDESEALIPDIWGLTTRVRKNFQAPNKYTSLFDFVTAQANNIKNGEPTIEDILTYVRSLNEIIGNSDWNGLTKATLTDLDGLICEEIRNAVNVDLPEEINPYHQLASWIGAIERVYPVEIFTTNYDLLTEQALVSRRVPYFDGFVGSHRTFFDLSSIEQEKLPSRWARLWKIHGSINWFLDGDNVVRGASEDKKNRLLIYPSHLKYAQSRRMPYLAMLDRLRAFLNSPQAVLVTCGYSFADQHLNEVILQGLNGNATATCFGLIFGDRASSADAVQAHKCANLSMLAADGAVIGTIDRDWSKEERGTHPLHGVAIRKGDLGKKRSTAAPEVSKFLLGDFKTLGEFLAHQLAHRREDEGTENVP
jgi:hypothetical protein